ncbi:innexin-11-like [Saccostrea echinata]|uniref:innexin-11-like n=1 Tax=Saccostrea echinata TaxID=191078 RepID=UPI002A830E53|nr:innexin-11-like [Saccostrea echinata]
MTDKKSTLSFESWVDKLNGKWTPLIFLTLGILAFMYPVCFNPIECGFPAEFTQSMVDYGKARCYKARTVRNVPDKTSHQNTFLWVSVEDVETSGETTLYQYVSLFLIVQAIFLRIPLMIWNLGKTKFGIHFIVHTGGGEEVGKSEGKRLAIYIYQWIQNRKINILSLGSFTIFQCFIKLMYFVSVSIHLGFLDYVLGQNNKINFGSFITGKTKENNLTVWKPSLFFPQHIMCNYTYYIYQRTRKYSVSCTLTLNPFLEQMVAVAWCWLIFCISATIADGIFHVFGAVLPFFRVWFVQSNLLKSELGNSREALSDRNIQRFSTTLGEDVISFLKHVQDSESGSVVMETVTELWRMYHGDLQHASAILSHPVHSTAVMSNPRTQQSHTQPENFQQESESSAGQGHKPTAPLLYPVYPTSTL